MRKFLLVVLSVAAMVALLGAGLLLGSGSAPRPYAPAGPGDVYLALGDSLAWGAQLDAPRRQSYPALLKQRLDEGRTISFFNLAVPGETSTTILRRQLPRALALIERERRAGRRVSPITVTIGGNDLRSAERATPARRAEVVERVGANLDRLLSDLRRVAGPDADIAVMTYYNPYGGDPSIPDSEAYWVGRLNEVIATTAARHSAAVADVFTPFEGGRVYTYTYILVGDVHANAEGHAVIASEFWEALQYLSWGSTTATPLYTMQLGRIVSVACLPQRS